MDAPGSGVSNHSRCCAHTASAVHKSIIIFEEVDCSWKKCCVEHNHVLIYVYACVVLEGLKWDDPFANLNQLRADAEKAIGFLRVTIQETPTVLNFTTPHGTFLRRGSEPLWAWLFPKLLKMLGYPKCLALTSALQSFFVFVLVDASKSAGLWNICEPLYGYLQANFRCKPMALH